MRRFGSALVDPGQRRRWWPAPRSSPGSRRWCSRRSSTSSSALPPGQARTDVLELARRAGVDVGQVYRVDASRRTTAINAYVNGIGSSKRVVLYDTLLNDLNRGERRAVVAHELGHVHGNDIQRGLLFVAIVTPLALIFVSGMARAIAAAARRPSRASPPTCRRSRSRSPRPPS